MVGFMGIFNCGHEWYKRTHFRWETVYCNFVQPRVLIYPTTFLLPFSDAQYIGVWADLSLCRRRMWPAISFFLVATMYWSRSMPAYLIGSSFVAWPRHEHDMHQIFAGHAVVTISPCFNIAFSAKGPRHSKLNVTTPKARSTEVMGDEAIARCDTQSIQHFVSSLHRMVWSHST